MEKVEWNWQPQSLAWLTCMAIIGPAFNPPGMGGGQHLESGIQLLSWPMPTMFVDTKTLPVKILTCSFLYIYGEYMYLE